jgi:LPS export ABC transporter protein LptC
MTMSSRAKRGICSWLVVASAVTLLASCRKITQPPVVGEAAIVDSAEQIIFDGHSVLTNRGVKRGEMFSDTIFVFNDNTRFALRRVRANFNTELGTPNGTLRGDRGTYDLRARILEGFGNVVVTSTDGKKLTSPHLKYTEATNLISSDSAFTLSDKDAVREGIGFTSDPNLTRLRCFRACRGSAMVPIKGIATP